MYNHSLYKIKNDDSSILLADLDKLVDKALKNIYNGFKGVEPNLYEITSTVLNNAVSDGLTMKYDIENAGLIHQLKTNVNVFSAFKAHNQCQDMVALLYDKNGKIRPESQWRKDALAISDHQNKQWLNTERNTALRRARFASDFKKFEDKKDLYPNLKWLPSTAGTPRTEHEKFYNKIWAINDPFWIINFPGNEWNCKCGIEQTKEGATDNNFPTTTKGAEGIDANPFFSGEIFTPTHPVFRGYIADGMNKREISQAKRKFTKDLNEFKSATAYKEAADFTFKNGSKIFIHDFCDSANLDDNLRAIFIVCSALPDLLVKLPPHLLNAGTNAEYIINNLIADLKVQSGVVVSNNLKRAIKQGCEAVVIRLTEEYPESVETYIDKAKGELEKLKSDKKYKSKVTDLYVIDKKNDVHYVKIEK